MRRLLTIIVAGAFAMGALAACSDNGETTISTPEGDIRIDRDGGGFSVEGEDGSFQVGTCDRLPDDFPSDVPLPDGNPISCSRFGSNGEVAWTVAYDTGDADTTASMKDALDDAGFEIIDEYSVDSSDGAFETFTATRGDLTVYVTVGADIAGLGNVNINVTRASNGS
jgi:hypothetical protein